MKNLPSFIRCLIPGMLLVFVFTGFKPFEPFTLENQHFRIAINPMGRINQLIDKLNGTDYALEQYPSPILALIVNDSTLLPRRAIYLPKERDGVRLRHAVEVRSATFQTEQFYDLARRHGVAICYAVDDQADGVPTIDQTTADFTYARLMSSREDEPTGMTSAELDAVAAQTRDWAKRGDVFAYFIAGAKVRNPAAAQALIKKLG